MSFDWRDGVHLLGSDLWFDAPRAAGLTFLSHAGIRASGPRLLTSPLTAKALRALGRRSRPLCPPLGRPLSVGEHRVELLASDLVPGAALLRVENRDGAAIYAGALAEGAEVRACDRLCLVAADPADGVPIESLPRLVENSLDGPPVFVAPGLPEAFASARLLTAAGVPVRAQATLRTTLRAMGLALSAWSGDGHKGEALLCTFDALTAESLAPNSRTHRLAPLAPSTAVVAAYARATGAGDIVVAGPHAATMVKRLGGEGIAARPLLAPDQLGLFAAAAWGSR